ncbi:MAG: hypothetical protein ACKOGA_22220, partial [Planctomycetaceae bacterium]
MSETFPRASPGGSDVHSRCLATRQWLATGELPSGANFFPGLVPSVAPESVHAVQLERARQHLSECDACQRWSAELRLFDNRVRHLLQETAVPSGGPDRLLRQLQLRDRALGLSRPEGLEASAADTTPATPLAQGPRESTEPGEWDSGRAEPVGQGDPPRTPTQTWSGDQRPSQPPLADSRQALLVQNLLVPPRERLAAADGGQGGSAWRSRRRWGAASLVALLLLAMGWWVWSPPQVRWQTVLARLAELDWRAPALRPFTRWSAATTPQLPAEMETAQIQSAPFSLPVEQVEVAVFFFESRRPGAKRVEAALAVLPVEQLAGGHRLGGFLST